MVYERRKKAKQLKVKNESGISHYNAPKTIACEKEEGITWRERKISGGLVGLWGSIRKSRKICLVPNEKRGRLTNKFPGGQGPPRPGR